MPDNEEGARPERWRERHQQQQRTWDEYRELVLQEMERIGKSINELSNRLDRNYHEYQAELSKVKIDMAMVKVKTGIWGGLLGALSGIITAVSIIFLKQH